MARLDKRSLPCGRAAEAGAFSINLLGVSGFFLSLFPALFGRWWRSAILSGR